MIEVSLSSVPRKTPGFYYTWKHYQNHVLSVTFYLNGYALETTILKRGFGIRFDRYQNLT